MRPWPYPRVLAHRGGGIFAPENTVAALRIGQQRGFRGVEFDVTLSADGESVLMHDATLNRTTDGRGPVAGRTWAELARLDAGGWFSPDFAREPIPRLADAIAFCRGHQVWINAEIKPAPGAELQTGQQVARAIARDFADRMQSVVAPDGLPDPQLPLLSSFSSQALGAARDAVPALPRGLLCGRIPRDWREQLQGLECVALHCDHRHLDAEAIEAVHSAGYWVFCYTVNDRRRATRLAQWGIEAFCTDRLDLIDPTLLGS
ncbi:MAG TPA: glycerophosphodiester phosphodiesterase [Burkholderiaceae bacterium]|nr:glycerophosphodiester phosphodiesterase [Burkholderiaceae bacterium]